MKKKLVKIPLIVFLGLFTFFNLIHESLYPIFIISVMFLLAEPHFAASWPYIFNKQYKALFFEKKFLLIYIPIIIIICSTLLFFLNFEIFTYLFLLANVYHVNKQSIGIWQIFGLKKDRVTETTTDIFTITGFYFLYHFFGIPNININFLIMPLLLLIIFTIYMFYKHRRENKFSLNYFLMLLQANLVFWPVCLTSNILLAFSIGISIHYVQYILITGTIFKFERSLIYIGAFVLVYTLITTYIQSVNQNILSWIILFPALAQLLHFYLDGLFWKLSDTRIKKRVLTSLKL